MSSLPRIIRFKVEFKTLNMLQVGRGFSEAYSSVDNPQLTYRYIMDSGTVIRVPVIPASTLKGVLRVIATRIAPYLYPGQRICATIQLEDYEEGECCNPAKGSVCPVCRVFGTRDLPGKISVSDAIPKDPVKLSRMIEECIYTHIRLSRYTQTVVRGALWTKQYIPLYTPFEFKLEYRLCGDPGTEDKDLTLVIRSLRMLPYERLGRAGLVQLTKVEVTPSLNALPCNKLPNAVSEIEKLLGEVRSRE